MSAVLSFLHVPHLLLLSGPTPYANKYIAPWLPLLLNSNSKPIARVTMLLITVFIACLQVVRATSLDITNNQPDVYQALAALPSLKLSPNARIILPNDTDWAQATGRWDPWR